MMDQGFNLLKQYRGCLYQFAMRTRFKYGKETSAGTTMKRSIGRFTPIFLRDNSNESKLAQLKKITRRLKIDVSLKNGFIYFLDEKTVPYNRNMTIDNMPVDYNDIVNMSLSDLRKMFGKVDNNISRRNIKLIDIIDEFICRIDSKVTEECSQQIEWIDSLRNRPANSLEEAIQRILFYNQMIWQTDHLLNGLGRLDKILARFENAENLEELMIRFFKTLHCYYGYKSNAVLGDTGQVIILGGLEADGEYFCNKITYSMLNVIKEINLPDPKLLLRVSTKMPNDLIINAIECISTGCGSPLLSNDDVVITAIEKFGYTHYDACNYGVSACWEPLVIGQSLEQNNLYDIEYGKIFVLTYQDPRFVNCNDIESLFELYLEILGKQLEGIMEKLNALELEKDPLCSLLCSNCLKADRDIAEGGSRYNNFGLLSVGLSSAVDSLINIKKYVFDEKKLSLVHLKKCLINDYSGYEDIKKLFSMRHDGFGSDSQISLDYTNRILDYTSEYLREYKNQFGGSVKFGLSSPAYVNSGKNVWATADGRMKGKPFSTHISRDDVDAIVSVVNFASALKYEGNRSNGNVVDVIVQKDMLNKNKDKFMKYVQSAIRMGVFQMQFNVISYEQLLDAKRHPEKYPNLIVRVWGFSAYFKDMPEDYQNAIIERARLAEGITT